MSNTTLKPFNLEKATAGEPIITRNGKFPTELCCFDTVEGEQKLIAVIDGVPRWFTKNGTFRIDPTEESIFDLFMAPIERKEWVVRNSIGIIHPHSFRDYYDASRFSQSGESTIHEITITE